MDRDDAFTKITPTSDTCIRCRGIEEFEKFSSFAVDGEWSPASALAVRKQYETAFGIIVNIFNLTNPRESDFVKAMPTQVKTDILPVLKVIWSAIGSTRGIRKMLSHFGAIKVPQRNALKEIMGGNIKRYYVDMQEYTSVEAEVSMWRYRLSYDAGNVAYANWLQNAIGRESVRLYTGFTSPSAEACGDLVEAALGVFEVLSAFVHIPCINPSCH